MAQENMTMVGNGFYVVRTQAGFRKAVKTALRKFNAQQAPNDTLSFGELKVLNWPKEYPSLVALTIKYSDGHGWNCPVFQIPLNKLTEALQTDHLIK